MTIFRFFGKAFGKTIASQTYIKNNVKFFLFPKLQKTRITVGILASIELPNGDLITIWSEKHNKFQPLGGALKIDAQIRNELKEKFGSITPDNRTDFKGKKSDISLFLNIKKTEPIYDLLKHKPNVADFLKSEIKREIVEEADWISSMLDYGNMRIINIWSTYKEKDISPLFNNDFSMQFITKIDIKPEFIDAVKDKIKSDEKNFHLYNKDQDHKKFNSSVLVLTKERDLEKIWNKFTECDFK